MVGHPAVPLLEGLCHSRADVVGSAPAASAGSAAATLHALPHVCKAWSVLGRSEASASAQIARGRMREFYQCDLDIAGAYPGMAADAEVVSVRATAPLWSVI